jgi:hypothetical protein
LLSGHQIEEIPITYRPRTYEEGKKIGGWDAVRAIMTIFRDRLGLTPVLKPTTTPQRIEGMKL